MPKIDPDDPAMPTRDGTRYPPPFDAPCRERRAKRLGAAGGLTDFGVNLVTIPPGSWSSQRHVHFEDDEFLMMVAGELVLAEEAGETVLRAGDFAAFPKARSGGHHLRNESGAEARFVVVGANKGDGDYPDIDMKWIGDAPNYFQKDGTPYPENFPGPQGVAGR